MKKSWKKPAIISLNNKSAIKSGYYAHGAERILTCDGAVTSPNFVSGYPSTFCTSEDSGNLYNCNGASSYFGGVYVGPAYGNRTITRAACS